MGKIVLTYTVFENELTKKYFFVSISFFFSLNTTKKIPFNHMMALSNL